MVCNEGIPNTYTSSPIGGHAYTEMDAISKATRNTSAEVHVGPLTRARAKLLNQQVLLFLNESIVIDENWVLPHANVLCILRFEEPAMDGDQEYVAVIQGSTSPRHEQ